MSHSVEISKEYLDNADRFQTIVLRVAHAEFKHPEGASLRALCEEVEEVKGAILEGEDAHTIYELYDVIAVCIRLIKKLED